MICAHTYVTHIITFADFFTSLWIFVKNKSFQRYNVIFSFERYKMLLCIERCVCVFGVHLLSTKCQSRTEGNCSGSSKFGNGSSGIILDVLKKNLSISSIKTHCVSFRCTCSFVRIFGAVYAFCFFLSLRVCKRSQKVVLYGMRTYDGVQKQCTRDNEIFNHISPDFTICCRGGILLTPDALNLSFYRIKILTFVKQAEGTGENVYTDVLDLTTGIFRSLCAFGFLLECAKKSSCVRDSMK